MRSDAIDRGAAIQSDTIVEKTILILYKFIAFSNFLHNFDPLSLT